MVERRGTKALELWCRRITDGYPGVNVINMTTSWRDGLAFCAMIHHFRPDLIDFNSLNKDDIYGNNELAFRIAEQHLNIPALLDAEDMATCKVPDRLSILTYLSQFYQVFGSSPSRLAMNRTTESASERIAPVTEPSQPKVSLRQGMRREPCTVCGLPVFLAEKLVIARSPYHRTCFRCARCRNQLTPGNYYETEGGEFCCETCPDEVYQSSQAAGTSSDNRAIFPANLDVPLSDEEKSSLGRNASLAQIQVATQRLRLDYMADDLLPDEDEEVSVVDGLTDEISDEESDEIKDDEEKEKLSLEDQEKMSESSCPQDVVNSALTSVDDKEKDNQHPTAICPHDVEIKEIEDKDNTKDTQDRPLSFVQQRLKMFEGPVPNQQQLPSTANRPLEPSDLSRLSQQPLSLEDQEESDVKQEDKLEEYPEDLNPFNDEDENDEPNPFDETEKPKPAARNSQDTLTKRKLEAPKINLNPFWSDDEGPESEDDNKDKTKPVPKPRTVKQTQESSLSQKLGLDRSSIYASNTSITSSGSATTSTTPGGSYRKKKPAPQPPTPNKSLQNANQPLPSTLSFNSSNSNVSGSTSTTPRARKTKPAPPPPVSASTPQSAKQIATSDIDESSVKAIADKAPVSKLHSWTDEKLSKDEANRNRQSLMSEQQPPISFPDKSVEGKWKRKKGPAPPRPTPHRRKIKVISIKDLKFELDEIELQQQGLEKQGVRLEQIIREKCESQVLTEDASLGVDVEELVMELFTLVNEKNELFRRQAELMLLRRQYRLEEEHADIEYQIRCLMCQPEATKTDFDKQREETLIQRLVEIVERRNEIVECLEMDRKREVEEDRSIHTQMGLYAAKNKGGMVGNNNETVNMPKKKNKLKEKLRERKLKKCQKKDADKDVDEAEAKLKRNTKRKWF